MIHPHASVPEMELIEQVGIDVEQVERRRIRQSDDLHVAKQQEQIVQLAGLETQLAFVTSIGHAVDEVTDGFVPLHWVIVYEDTRVPDKQGLLLRIDAATGEVLDRDADAPECSATP